MFSNVLSRRSMARLGLMGLLLMLGMVSGLRFAVPIEIMRAQSTTSAIHPLDLERTTAAKRFDCTISEVIEWVDNGSSVLIGCQPGDGTTSFFAQSTADPRRAARVLALTLTAVSLGKQVWIQYDPDDTNVTGCKVSNCRMIIGMGMANP